MTTYLYMNHRIRKNPPDGPVIVRQDSYGVFEANEFEIRFGGQPIGRVKFDRHGLAACETHDVRAWVEFEDDVEVISVARAAAKRPKRVVRTGVEKAFDQVRKK